MAGPVFMLASDAIREVLARCDLLDDDVSNPALESAIVLHLNSAQRQLQVEHAWLVQKRSAESTITGPSIAIPVDARYGRVLSATWTDGATPPIRLVPGIPADAQPIESVPERFDVIVASDGGLTLETWPTASGGTMTVTYQTGVVPIALTTDRLSLDDEAVIGRAAVLLAASKNLPVASTLLAAHNSFLNRSSRQQSPGSVFSMRREF